MTCISRTAAAVLATASVALLGACATDTKTPAAPQAKTQPAGPAAPWTLIDRPWPKPSSQAVRTGGTASPAISKGNTARCGSSSA